jgi:dTDP-4-dehydrorhamnose reductase
MKSLIIGANGLVGSALCRYVPDALQGIQMEASHPDQIYIDITKYETLFKAFQLHRPDVVYLSAAIAHVDKCEDYGTSIVNIRGVTQVIRLCEMFGSRLVWFSSSYVFDGKSELPYLESDDPNPIQQYGRQKLTIENLLAMSDLDWLVIRTVGVFGTERKKKNFAKQVISSVFAGRTVYAPVDQFMNPILSNDLASAVVALVRHRAQGIVHVAGDECISKYEFAQRIAGYFGYQDMVKPVTTDQMNQRAARPRMGCLDCTSLADYGIDTPSFSGGVQKFLASEEWNG